MAGDEVYEFGEFVLDVPERRLSKGERILTLAPQAYDVLVALVREAGRLITKRRPAGTCVARLLRGGRDSRGPRVEPPQDTRRSRHRGPGHRNGLPCWLPFQSRGHAQGCAPGSVPDALALDPDHTEAYLLYGRLLETLGDLDQALAAKQKALERDPRSPLVHLQIALSFWNQRRYDDVLEWANRALDLDPGHLAVAPQWDSLREDRRFGERLAGMGLTVPT